MKRIRTILSALVVTVAIGLGIAAFANRNEPAYKESVVQSMVQTESERSTPEAEEISWADDDH